MLIASVGSFMAEVALIALLWPIPGVAASPTNKGLHLSRASLRCPARLASVADGSRSRQNPF